MKDPVLTSPLLSMQINQMSFPILVHLRHYFFGFLSEFTTVDFNPVITLIIPSSSLFRMLIYPTLWMHPCISAWYGLCCLLPTQ